MKAKTLSEIKKKYTRIDQLGNDFILVTLVAGNQTFHMSYQPTNKTSAKWYQTALAKAIKKIIEEER